MNRVASISTLVAFVAVMALSGSARAGVIYDNGLVPSSSTGGLTADVSNTSTVSSAGFSIGTAAQINEVRWDGKYFSGNVAPATDAFTIRFYDLSGSVPGSTPLFSYFVGNAVGRASTGITDGNGNSVYSYDAFIPTTSLASGRYAFSVQDNTNAPGSNNYFFWTYAFSPGRQVFFGSSLLDGNSTTAFILLGTNAVPEPASLLMLGTGSLILLACARRRRPRVGGPRS